MADKDATVAVENAIQKLEQHPSLIHQYEKLTSIKQKLQRLGSNVASLVPNRDNAAGVHEISQLSQLRGVAYDTEDVVNSLDLDVAAEINAKRKLRKLRTVLSFVGVGVGGTEDDYIIPHDLKEQLEDIDKRVDTISIGGTEDDQRPNKAPGSSSDSAASDKPHTAADIGIPKDLNLFYLSLSGYPEGTEILVRSLIQVWIAQGFLKRKGENTVVTVAEDYGQEIIEALLETGFLKEKQMGIRGSPKTFTIDDDKLQLCRVDAENQEFIKLKQYKDGTTDNTPNRTSAATTTERQKPDARLAIHLKDEGKGPQPQAIKRALESGNDYSTFRSLQIHSTNPLHLDLASSSRALLSIANKGFNKLRVLELGFSFPLLQSVPDEIGKKMVHLRYLRLIAPDVNRIPSSIWKLPKLQTLDMKETKMVKTLSKDIWGSTRKGSNLRHLHLGGFATLPPPRRPQHYNALDNLRTLSGICPDTNLKRLVVRAKFLNLRRLKLHIKSPKGSSSASISSKSSNTPSVNDEAIAFLDSLDHLYHLRSLTISGPVGGLPQDRNAFPISLTKMTLSGTKIPVEECVAVLEKIPNLRFLKLLKESVIGTKITVGIGGFPALQALRLEELGDLESWTLEKRAMRCVRYLTMTNCGKLVPPEELKEKLESRGDGQIIIERPAANGCAHPAAALAIDWATGRGFGD